MAADYRINLSNTMTSSRPQRKRFYFAMLFYLLLCAVILAVVAYFTSRNMVAYVENSRKVERVQTGTLAVSGLKPGAFENPMQLRNALELGTGRISGLEKALKQRKLLLPVLYNLFSNLPADVRLQSFSGNNSQILFGLILPETSKAGSDPVSRLTAEWEASPVLMERVESIRSVKRERRAAGQESVVFVQFECELKK